MKIEKKNQNMINFFYSLTSFQLSQCSLITPYHHKHHYFSSPSLLLSFSLSFFNSRICFFSSLPNLPHPSYSNNNDFLWVYGEQRSRVSGLYCRVSINFNFVLQRIVIEIVLRDEDIRQWGRGDGRLFLWLLKI